MARPSRASFEPIAGVIQRRLLKVDLAIEQALPRLAPASKRKLRPARSTTPAMVNPQRNG
jgi:hypothetical protein